MNSKKILFGLTAAATLFSFTACGGEGGDNPVGPGSSSSKPVELPKESSLNPVLFNEPSVTVMSGMNGMQGSLSGVITIDPDFFSSEGAFEGDTNQVTRIDSVHFAVGKPTGDGKIMQEPIAINLDGQVLPTDRISLSQKFFEFSQLSSCGVFNLYITVFSSTKHTVDPKVKTITYTNTYNQLTFTRNESECKAPEPESSSASEPETCTPVTATEIKLSNETASDQSALNFETGTADNPHVTLHISGREASLVPGAGVSVFEDNSQTTGLQPEVANPGQPVCLEKFKASARAYEEELTSGLWLEVVANGKTYPVMIKKPMFESNTKGSVTLVYYK